KKVHFVAQEEETHEITDVQDEFILRTCKGDETINEQIKKVYTKNSRTTLWRQNKKKREEENARENQTADISFNNKTPNNTLLNAKALSNTPLNDKALAPSNILINAEASASRRDKMNASFFVARTVWNKGDYTARALKMHIEEAILPKIENAKNTISEKMCRIYMHVLGYKYDERKKGVYYDGHERPDVVAYRKGWLERMFRYKMYMKDFVGDMLEIVIEPELESDERELVQVTHDECHFYANDE
ncbi:21017_t:CDS:2, partial [Dentiscutata erythropus]